MTFFENILKKRLGNATSDKGVAPEDLWAAIEHGLPPEEEKRSPFKWTTFGLALFGLVLALGVSFSIFLQEDLEEMPATIAAETVSEDALEAGEVLTAQLRENDNVVMEVPTSEAGDTAKTDLGNQQNQQDKKSASIPSVSAESVSTGNAQRTTVASLARDELTEITAPLANKEEPVTSTIVADATSSEIIEIDTRLNRENLPENKAIAVRNEAENAATTAVRTKDLEAIGPRNETAVAKLDLQPSITPLVRANKEPSVENFKSISPIKQLRRSRIDLGVFVGTNMLRNKYPSASTDALAAALNASRGEALGQSAALEIGYRLKPGLKVYTGIELLKTHTTFRYTQQWDTVTMRNGQQVDAIAIRRVQHNNRQALLSVPLMLEKTFASGRWEAGLAAGVSLNYLTQQTGRSLNAMRQVVTYSSGGGANLPSPNFYLSYQLRPSINYRLNSQVSIQARADIRWQRYGKSALYELSANSTLYGGSLGVVFGL
jgi:hypothetical protein